MIKFLLNAIRWPLRLGIGGGSGGSGSNVTEWKPLAELQPYHQQVVQQASALAEQPYEAYPYHRVADMNSTQMAGLQKAADLSNSGSPATAAAGNMTLNTLAGGYQNPYATMQTAMAANPLAGATSSTGSNDFMGINNPYLRGMIQSGQEDLAKSYRFGTAPQNDAMAALSRNYGGSAHQQATQMNQDQLLKALQGVESNYGNMAYQQSAGLMENQLNRDLNAQQTDLSRNSGLYENAINRGISTQQADKSAATGAWEAERARQMAAVPNAISLYQNDLGAAKTLTGVGDALQQQQQTVYNDLANEWARNQAYPQAQLDSFLNTLIRASGGFGTNTATTTQNNTINPASALLGGGLMGYGLMGG
jgi:hypothetical protein